MKKRNFLFKGLSVLGALLLLMNLALPGFVTYAADGDQDGGDTVGGGAADDIDDIDNTPATPCIAKILDTCYGSLSEAISAAKNDDTIILLSDDTLTNNQWIQKSINIDLNTHKISGNSYYIVFDGNITAKLSSGDISTSSYTYVQNSANVTMNNLNYTSSTYGILAFSATVTLENVNLTGYIPIRASDSEITIESGKYNGSFFAIDDLNGSNIIINDGIFSGPESAIHFEHGGKITINSGNFSSSDNCVLRTQGNAGYGENEITVNGGTYDGHITSDGYIACGIYVANNDTVNVNAGTFNIYNGVGILGRSGKTTIKSGVVINLNNGDRSGKVGDANINITADGHKVVHEGTAGYPGGDPIVTMYGEDNIIYVHGESDFVKVTFYDGETILGEQALKKGVSIDFKDPEKEGFEFKGWYTDPSLQTAFEGTSVNEDTLLYAKWNEKKVVTWLDGDGNTLKTEEVEVGEIPQYSGDTPTKTATVQYTYEFANSRDPELSAIESSVDEYTYTAKFNETVNQYSITFVDEDDRVISQATLYDYGTPADQIQKPADLTKAEDASCTYTLSWTPALANVTADATYKATFTCNKKSTSTGGGSSSGGGGSSRTSSDNSSTPAEATPAETDTPEQSDSSTDAEDTPASDEPTVVEYDPNLPADQQTLSDGLTPELHNAYDFAHKHSITTKPNAIEADMYGPLNRAAMAKMLSNYAMNVLGQTPANIVVPEFVDVDQELIDGYDDAIATAYRLGIMGINMPNNEFRPYDEVTRAEFGTALSRMLFKLADSEELYYEPHLAKLITEKIMTNDDPDMIELRGYVMIMLMRSANKQ